MSRAIQCHVRSVAVHLQAADKHECIRCIISQSASVINHGRLRVMLLLIICYSALAIIIDYTVVLLLRGLTGAFDHRHSSYPTSPKCLVGSHHRRLETRADRHRRPSDSSHRRRPRLSGSRRSSINRSNNHSSRRSKARLTIQTTTQSSSRTFQTQ